MASSPFQRLPLEAALESHGNDSALPPNTPSVDATRSPLSPSDCRTLKKILEDVQSPSRTASPVLTTRNERHLITDSPEDGSSDMGNEDVVQYTKKHYDYGDKADEGYEDEDKSMDLSDAVDASVSDEDESVMVGDDGTRENVCTDGDTIEEIMNTPGKTAPPAREQDLGVYLHNQATLDETKVINLQRAAIEEVLGQERADQEREDAVTVADAPIGLHGVKMVDQDDAIVLSDDPEFRAVETTHAKMGTSFDDDHVDGVLEVEFFEPLGRDDRRSSRCFSPASPMRRASADPLPSSCLADCMNSRPAVTSTPSGRHLDFTMSSTVLDTPFTKTLHYYKQQKGKENSPSKSRRKAALPEEIAELVRDAEEEDLDKYREIDLAPMEPVIESDTAGDLINFGTPMKAKISTSRRSSTGSNELSQPIMSVNTSHVNKFADSVSVPTVLDILSPVEIVEACSKSSSRLSLPVEQNEDSDADAEDSEATSDSEDKQLILYPQHPAFVNVIGMLPEAFFWATAASIAKYSTRAYDALINKFAGLELSGRNMLG